LLDAIHLEQHGVPTVTFVTEPFLEAARTHARIHGMPDVPLIVIPTDDYLRQSDEELAANIEPVVVDVVSAIFGQ
jgi:hypothetical protein